MRPEWIPTDEELSIYLGLPVEENLITERERKCVAIAQHKLLEYLLENSYLVQPVEGKAYRVTNTYTLKEMLKDLGGKNG